MTIDIIIPMMDRAGDLERSLHTLLAQDYEHYRVYIVDMGSTDHLDEVLNRQSSDRLRLIRCRRPDVFSFSRSRNLGARHSTGQFLLFLNGDNYLQDSTVLSRMLRDLASGEGDSDWYARWREEQG